MFGTRIVASDVQREQGYMHQSCGKGIFLRRHGRVRTGGRGSGVRTILWSLGQLVEIFGLAVLVSICCIFCDEVGWVVVGFRV
jgi:hypothetical protein